MHQRLHGDAQKLVQEVVFARYLVERVVEIETRLLEDVKVGQYQFLTLHDVLQELDHGHHPKVEELIVGLNFVENSFLDLVDEMGEVRRVFQEIMVVVFKEVVNEDDRVLIVSQLLDLKSHLLGVYVEVGTELLIGQVGLFDDGEVLGGDEGDGVFELRQIQDPFHYLDDHWDGKITLFFCEVAQIRLHEENEAALHEGVFRANEVVQTLSEDAFDGDH